MDKETTIFVNIPPIEIGEKDGDEFEEAAAHRTIINRRINDKFTRVVSTKEIAKKQKTDQSMLEDDGHHLTPAGGKLIADLIAVEITQRQTRKPLQPISPKEIRATTSSEQPSPISTTHSSPPTTSRTNKR